MHKTMWVRGLSILAACALLAGCGSAPTPSRPISSPASSSGPSSNTSLPANSLPAGVQYLAASTDLPTTSSWYPKLTFSVDGKTTMALGYRTTNDLKTYPAGVDNRLAIKQGSGPWQDTELAGVPGPLPTPPAGYPSSVNDFGAFYMAAGSAGIVLIGTADFQAANLKVAVVSTAWFSADGKSWQTIDLRGAIGADSSFMASDVTATATGFVIVGSLADLATTKATTLVALTSVDGVNWKLGGTAAGTWAVDAARVTTFGSKLLLTGSEYPCQTVGNSQTIISTFGPSQTYFGPSGVYRVWSSADGGQNWSPVDIATAGLNPKITFPTDASGCPQSDDYTTLATFDSNEGSPELIGAVGDKVFIQGADGGKVAVSTDLTHWTASSLPGALPAAGGNASISRLPIRKIVADGKDLVLLSFEPARNADNQITGFGSQVLAWRSADAGASWTQITPVARPIVVASEASLAQLTDGTVALSSEEGPTSAGSSFPNGRTSTWSSVAGVWQSWGSCQPAPKADCSFAKVSGIAAGADLNGIDLLGAQVTASDLSRANLSGANLRAAAITAPMTGANLSGVDASGAALTGDLTGADLTNANVTRVTTGPSIFLAKHTGADLAGDIVKLPAGDKTLAAHDFGVDNLTLVEFQGPAYGSGKTPASLAGADFSNVTFSESAFSGVDLTGAKFKVPANFSGAYWITLLYGITCPDGAPPGGGLQNYIACRIGK
jgi:uncharacterized protein YjbI with pentapeptide repeats